MKRSHLEACLLKQQFTPYQKDMAYTFTDTLDYM